MPGVNSLEDLEAAKRQLYENLAQFMIDLVDLRDVSVVLEAGCGSGRLTLPLATKVQRKCKIVAYDLSSGPYEGSLDILKKSLDVEGLNKNVEIVKGDVRDMKAISNGSVGLIVSNELFCDLDRGGLELALSEFHRILKRGGQMIHAELSPVAENRAQELLIEADVNYSIDSMLPEGTCWFSPTVDEVAVLMHKTGFRSICARYSQTDLKLSYQAAIEQLRRWKIDQRFAEEYKADLQHHGLEFPLEHVVTCRKP